MKQFFSPQSLRYQAPVLVCIAAILLLIRAYHLQELLLRDDPHAKALRIGALRATAFPGKEMRRLRCD